MNWRKLWFVIPALISAFAVIKVSSVPLAILYGKIPEPPADLLLHVIGVEVLPIFGPAALMILLAWRIYARGGAVPRWALLLLAAPVVAFVMMFFAFRWS